MSAAGNNEREKDIIDHSILPGSPLRFSMSEILSSFSGWREDMLRTGARGPGIHSQTSAYLYQLGGDEIGGNMWKQR
jgi:hypothetical protein